MLVNKFAAALAVVVGLVGFTSAYGVELLLQPEAARHGLSRPWFQQVDMDAGRSRVQHVVVDDGVIYVQTNRAMIHALNAETGRTLWSRQVGRPNHPSMAPALNKDLLAVVNGSRLFAVNRFNGEILFDIQVGGAPGAGPALSARRAFVPMVSGLMMAYRLESMTDPNKELGRVPGEQTAEEKAAEATAKQENIRLRQEYIPPLATQADGRAMVQPIIGTDDAQQEYCIWPTDKGFLNFGIADSQADERFFIKFTMHTRQPIEARPAYIPADGTVPGEAGTIIAGSRDGFVYAIAEKTGETRWRYSAGEAIVRSPVVIDDRIYVCTQLGGMHCLDAKTGKDLWWAADIMRFLAAGKHRVYVADRYERLLALNAASGQRVDTILMGDFTVSPANERSDRIYVVNPRGLVQCLREIELNEPLAYNVRKAADAPAAIQQQGMEGAAEKPAGRPKPGGGPAKPPTKPAEKPGEKPGDEADPFK